MVEKENRLSGNYQTVVVGWFGDVVNQVKSKVNNVYNNTTMVEKKF